ncbi:hypothetical protein [Streptomyces sp. NPDC088925]|uniref:zinc finger domain-containing protein n=1 Tax=Streptomyces sp. NPDC088925 TaxID=3365914 RepID=UPI00380FD7DF
MNAKEAAALLAHASGFDNRQPSVAAAQSWAAALPDVPCDQDARDAVAAYYSTPPQNPSERLWILPHHVRTLRTKIRNARLENFQYEPLPDETTAEFLARYRGQVKAIASGRTPAPTRRPALTGGPHPSFTAELEARGWKPGRTVPDTDAEAVADSVRRAGPLGIECPQCKAAIGRPCKTPGGNARQPMGKPRRTPHSIRTAAAQGRTASSPEERAREEERRREASRLAAARHEEGIHDAEIVEEETR